MPLNECGLQAAEANRSVVRILKEADDCWGVTPASGTSREVRLTSSSLVPEKTTVVSNELRADRMVSDVVEVAAMSGGELNVEFSAGSLDDFLEAFLLGAWTRPMTFDQFKGTTVSWTDSNTITIAGQDVSAYFTVGRRIKTEGFINPANNGYFQISAVSFGAGNTTIDVTTSTSVAESGTATTKVMDANDVFVLNSTAIRAGTGGANAFDSNGGNAFDAARDAGQIVVGQKVYVAGLGYEQGTIYHGTLEVGSIEMTDVAEPDDAITIDDGVNPLVTFTFQVAGDDAVGTAVTVAHGATATDSATNLRAAIAANQVLNVVAGGATTTVTVTNRNLSTAAQTDSEIAETVDASANITVTDFAGSAVANPADEDTVTIFDGEKTVVFEYDDDGAFTRGRIPVTIGATGIITATNLHEAIMQQLWANKFKVKATVDGAAVQVYNISQEQGTGTLSDSGTNVGTVDFTGGDATIHGFFTVVSVDTAGDVLTVAEDVGTFANANGIVVNFKGSHVRNPGDLADIQAQSFTVEQGFADVSQYMKFTGMRVGSFTLALSAGEIVTGTIALMGKETTTHSATVIGQSPYTALATTSTPVLNATVNVGNVYKNGEVLASALQSIEINGEAALRNQSAVSSKFPAGIGTGRFNLTGSMTAYFETLDLFDNFLNHDTISLAFDFEDNDHNAYWFTVPALKITSDPIAPGGIDQDVLEEMEFVAFRDSTLSTQFMVDRFSSLTAV